MPVQFTAHNIRLDDGTFTKPELGASLGEHPWFVSAKGLLETVFPGDKSRFRVADLGCLEGGYSVEMARMGFQVLGLDVRESNIAACRHVKAHTNLPNLEFVQDDAWNIAKHGTFDAVFCCGLLYHLDRPKQFLQTLSTVTRKLLILQTHFAEGNNAQNRLPRFLRRLLVRLLKCRETCVDKYGLSAVTENESLRGRWYPEFPDEQVFRDRENKRESSWDNRRSFWVQREYLLQAIREAGFDLVMEQFDNLGPQIAESMLRGFYKGDCRGTFIGIKNATR